MISIRRQALAFCLATFFSLHSNAQDYTTDNLVNGTWHGTVNNTTVTGGEGSHTQSSGPTPIYNSSTNTITWSYSQTSVLNIIGINAALSAAGTGIRISGYNYSWEYYNQEWNRGFLSAITQQYGSNGTLLEQYSYSMPQTTNGWTLYSGTQNYTNQYELTSLGNFALYFTGRDDRFWAGYYGPMVRNPSISFNYTVGPSQPEQPEQPEPNSCGSMYSLSCPQNTFAFIESVTASEPIVEVTPTVANEPVQEIASTSEQQENVSQSSSAEPSSSSQSSSGGSRVSLSSILNILSREQSRISSVERSTVESSVEQSVSQANQSMDEANSIASSNLLQSQNSASLSGENLRSEESKSESVSFSGFSAVDLLNTETSKIDDSKEEKQKTNTVNRNVPNNDLAGGVTIASIATQPVGFQAYSTTMPDGMFYAPKEIYKNQKVIDNPSGRRLFGGTDRLHQQMVDEQYK